MTRLICRIFGHTFTIPTGTLIWQPIHCHRCGNTPGTT